MKQKQKTKHRSIYYIETSPAPCKDMLGFLPILSLWYDHKVLERQHLPLGESLEILIYSLWQGFHPDTFTALCGCVAGGGSIVILGPPLSELPHFQDPSLDAISNWPKICPTETYYLEKMSISLHKLLGQQKHSKEYYWLKTRSDKDLQQHLQRIISQQEYNEKLEVIEPSLANPDQSAFIHQALDFNDDNPWIKLFANRGFGKTTALQLLVLECAARWSNTLQDGSLKQPNLQIYFVTQRKQPRLTMQQWFNNHPVLRPWVSQKSKQGSLLSVQVASLESLRKLDQQQHLRLILIDECASYNISTLKSVLDHLNTVQTKVVLASSIDGYEGSAKNLAHYDPPRRTITMPLTLPMRWSSTDPVDRWIKQFFFAQTNQTTQTHKPESIDAALHQFLAERCQPESFWPAQATHTELGQWMDLMSTAHYRTRPSDLRIMLDAPGQVFFCLRSNQQILAGIWLSLEGPIPQYLHQDIMQGRRRLKGHLAPQYAAKHMNSSDLSIDLNADLKLDPIKALQQQWIRIIRIAVAPAAQRLGLGSDLIEYCQRKYSHATMAVSFMPKEYLSCFWLSLGFTQITKKFYINRHTVDES